MMLRAYIFVALLVSGCIPPSNGGGSGYDQGARDLQLLNALQQLQNVQQPQWIVPPAQLQQHQRTTCYKVYGSVVCDTN